jgi:hypothetical protein
LLVPFSCFLISAGFVRFSILYSYLSALFGRFSILFSYLSAGFVRSSFLLSYLRGKILPEGAAADGVAG